MEYIPPPYPVYKAFFIPYLEGGKHKSCREVTEADVDDWRGVLNSLKSFLLEALKVSGCSGESRLELLGDLITIFFKAPLLREPISGTMNPFKSYVIWRIIPEQRQRIEVRVSSTKFAENLFGLIEAGEAQKDLTLPLQILEDAREKVEKCWFVLPADTRPGSNTSGLIPHSLTTSALAWAFAVGNGFGRRDIAIARLAALLHDFGKPFKAQEHVKASVEVAGALLDGLVEKEELVEILSLIEQHHQPKDSLAQLIRRADHLSSSVDRVHSLMEKYLFQDLQKLTELTVEELWRKIQTWEFWEEIHEKDSRAHRELSEKFVKEIREETENFIKSLPPPEGEFKPVGEIKFGIIDLASIQEAVKRSFELKAMSAASFTIDVALMVHIPALLQAEGNWLPFECFLYQGGGNTIFLFPAKYESLVISTVDEFNKLGNLKIRLAITDFVAFLPMLLKNLGKEAALRKLEARLESILLPPVKNYCESCFLQERKKGEWCEECSSLMSLGRLLYLKGRWSKPFRIGKVELGKPEEVFGKWEEVENNLMEILAGHDLNELERGVERRNYAVLKADGGFMGAFMGTSISLTDAIERSARIDLSLKKAFEESVVELFKSMQEVNLEEAKKAAICAKLGLLYMGGDDTLLLLNSWYAPLLALSMARKFREYMGEMRGISIGLAAGKSKAPIWSLIDAASELLDIAKGGIRNSPEKSSICLDVCEVPLSSTGIRCRRKELESRKITCQPFLVDNQKGLLDEMLENLSGGKKFDEWYVWAFTVSRSQGGEEPKKKLKKLRRAMSEALERAEEMLGDLPLSQGVAIQLSKIYLLRQRNRLKSEEREAWEKAMKFVLEKDEKALYGDAELLIKFFGGGMI